LSGHGPIFEWQDFKTEDFLDLMSQLEDLGFQLGSDEMKQSITDEVNMRKDLEARGRDDKSLSSSVPDGQGGVW